MRKILFRYNPMHHGNTRSTNVQRTDSSVPQQQQQQQQQHNPTPPSLPGGGFFSPCSYQASIDFIVKPQEKLVIVFHDSDDGMTGDHPELIRDIRPGWAQIINLVSDPKYLAIVVHNTREKAHVCVHKGARLHRLLRAPMIKSHLTILSAKQMKEDKINILFGDEQNSTSPPPPSTVSLS
jgi:hypothetical protein